MMYNYFVFVILLYSCFFIIIIIIKEFRNEETEDRVYIIYNIYIYIEFKLFKKRLNKRRL